MDVNFLNDINYLPWLIPASPLLAFFIITLLTNRGKMVRADNPHEYGGHHPDYDGMEVPVVTFTSRVLSITVGMAGVLAAWILSLKVFFDATSAKHFGEEVFASSEGWLAAGRETIQMGILVDPLTVVALFFVPITVACIFIYSIGYMAHDPRQSRFFAMISLFAGAMLTLVVADNLLLLFVGWEIMGLCSYLLIGFWFEKESAYNAAIKAFTTTRIADVIMLLGIVYLYTMTGTLGFREIMYEPAPDHIQIAYEAAHEADADDAHAEEADTEHGEEAAAGEHEDKVITWAEYLATQPAIIFSSMSAASVIGIFLIIGTIGKSAQFPLHVWLPDAMEGPTPVSAMIHAAAMVSAGVYMVIRMYPILSAGGDPHLGDFTPPLNLMAIVGGFTALFAATIATVQNDIKRVLAYSTISQLGFMVAALGIGAYIAAAFHLMTHAFFKALLFMASGSVIHAMEHGEHHVHEHSEHDDEHGHEEDLDPQNMMNMGGLRHRIPVTAWTFLAGGLSLAGFPLITAGFWSKDEILADGYYGLTHGYLPHMFVFVMLALAAFLTAFYTARQLSLTFFGKPRTKAAEHAGLGGPRHIISITMQLPLIILAVCAIFVGFIGVPPDFPILGSIFSPENNPFHHFVGGALTGHLSAPDFNWIPVLTSFSVALGGLFTGYWFYGRKPLEAGETDPLKKMLPPWLFDALENLWYIDEVYAVVFVQPAQWFSHNVASEFLDHGIIDGILHTIAKVFTWIGDLCKVINLWLIDGVGDGIPEGILLFGKRLRRVQSGRVQQYMLMIFIAALLIGIMFIVSIDFLQAAK